jgi:hypothetical protein
LEQFQSASLPDEPDLDAAVTHAETEAEIADYQSLLSSLGGLDTSASKDFVQRLGDDVRL